MNDSVIGLYKQLGIPVKLSETPGMFKKRAPGLGEHTDVILKEMGYKDNDITKLKKENII